jgi:hypothetical protein
MAYYNCVINLCQVWMSKQLMVSWRSYWVTRSHHTALLNNIHEFLFLYLNLLPPNIPTTIKQIDIKKKAVRFIFDSIFPISY